MAPALVEIRSERLKVAFFVLFGAAVVAWAASARAQPESLSAPSEARSHLAAARHAASAGMWEVALAEFTRSSELEPSVAAAEGIARSLDALHDPAAAYRAYRQLLGDDSLVASASVRQHAEARLVALASETATLVVQVDPPGARVMLDGVDEGDAPLPAPLRVNAGSHRMRVLKQGFRGVEETITAVAGAADTIPVRLVAEGSPAALAPVSVAPVSVAPVSVAPVSVAPASVAPASVAPVSVAPVSVAPVTGVPRPATAVATASPVALAAITRGAYGGVIVHLTLEPGGVNGDACSVPGITQCSTSSPVGGGFVAYAGYMVDPIGIDALFGVQADVSTVTATAQGQTGTVVVPRVGGISALRARLQGQTSAARFVLAAGVGVAFRDVGLVAGGLDTVTYWAPAVTLEGSARLRISGSTAFSLGLLFWGENAGDGVNLQVKAKPLMTTVHALRSTQAFFLPFIGMEFGP
jgi:hypothetical protein